MTTNTKILCQTCGGDRLRITAWVWANDDIKHEGDYYGRYSDSDGPSDNVWCSDCKAETGTVYVNELEGGKFQADTYGDPMPIRDTREAAWADATGR